MSPKSGEEKAVPSAGITGKVMNNPKAGRQAGRGSASSLSRTALPDSRLGGVRRLALTVTQVSVGSQGSLLGGAQTDRQAGQLQSSPQLSSLLGM